MLVSNDLPATATRKDWGFVYLPNTDPVEVYDGRLLIVEETGKRVRRTVTSGYFVEEVPARGHRGFLLVFADRAGDLDTAAGRAALARVGDVYQCRVGGFRPACTCPGFAAGGRECKHLIALAGLVATGDLPSPMGDPADTADTERQPA